MKRRALVSCLGKDLAWYVGMEVNVHEAKTHLSRIPERVIERVGAYGVEVVWD